MTGRSTIPRLGPFARCRAPLVACALSLAAPVLAEEAPAEEPLGAAAPADGQPAAEPADVALAGEAAPELAADPVAARPFHCDGTDPALFQEMQEAGWVGYGETWDLHTCAQGRDVYVPGATSRWKAWRLQRGATTKSQEQASFLAMLFPFVAFGILGSIFGLAWILAVVLRRRRIPRVLLSCPSCGVEMPVPLDDPAFRSMFCPSCGGACVVVDHGSDGRTRARVRAL